MKFKTRIIRYEETINKKRVFHKDKSIIIKKSRYETIEEVFARVTAWLNDNNITNPHINMVPSRIDPCIGCLTEPNWVGKNPYKISNYTCVIEVFVIYECADEKSDGDGSTDSSELEHDNSTAPLPSEVAVDNSDSNSQDKKGTTPRKIMEVTDSGVPITPVVELAEENVSSSTSEL